MKFVQWSVVPLVFSESIFGHLFIKRTLWNIRRYGTDRYQKSLLTLLMRGLSTNWSERVRQQQSVGRLNVRWFSLFLQQQRSPPIYNNNRYFYWFVNGLFSPKLRICRSYRYSRQSVNMSSEMLRINARNSNSIWLSQKLNETRIVCELSANKQVLRRFRLDSNGKSDYVHVSVLFDLFDETMIMSLEMHFVQTVRCQLSAC